MEGLLGIKMRDFASQNVALDRKVEELNFLLYVHYSDSYLRRCGDIIGGYYAVLVPGMFGGGVLLEGFLRKRFEGRIFGRRYN